MQDRPFGTGGTGGTVLSGPPPEPALYDHRGFAVPVSIRCYRHEGIVVSNHQSVRGLSRLAATWELTLADGRTLTGPAGLPDLRPGETAAVPLPFALPPDGGEAWLTLRVTTTEDEPWAPRGTPVCTPRLRLRAPVAPVMPVAPVAPVVRIDAALRVPGTASPGPGASSGRRTPADVHRRGRTLRVV